MSPLDLGLAALALLLGAACVLLWLGYGRARRASREAEAARAAALAAQRQTADLAAAAERIRILREMHDVIAHSLAIMIAQADGGSFVTADAEASRRAFLTIAEIGRVALADTRRILGVLRHGQTEEPRLAPVDRAGAVKDLVAQARAAGLAASLIQVGDPRPLPSAARLALFRICQEALTNVLKHAGEGARVVVTENWRADEVVLTITDADGQGGQGSSTDLGDLGLGLIGMRERAELLGGTLVAGPTETGGFQVRTALPFAGPGDPDAPAAAEPEAMPNPVPTVPAMTGVEQ